MLSGVRRLYRCYIGGGYHKLVILQTYYQVSGVEGLENLEGWQQLAEDRSPKGQVRTKPALRLGGFELPSCCCQQVQPYGRHTSVVVLASK